MALDETLLANFHRALVGEIRRTRPQYLADPFRVEEIYEDLVPYRTHRNVIGVAMNGDYEDVLLRLLSGQGDYLRLQSPGALRQIRKELESSNPNTSLFRQFSSVDVRLNPESLETGDLPTGSNGSAAAVPVKDLAPEPTLEALGADRDVIETSYTVAAPGNETSDVGQGDRPGAPPSDSAGDGQDEETAHTRAPDPASPSDDVVDEIDELAPDEDGADEPELPSSPRDVREATESAEDATGVPSAGAAPLPTFEDPFARDASDDPADTTPSEREAVSAQCPWCTQPLPTRAQVNFCPHCGGDTRMVACVDCGEALEASWRYCVACGTRVEET